MMDRRAATRALAGAALSGAALLDSLEGWLQPAPAPEPGNRRGRIGMREVQELEGTARAFRAWDHRFGGGLRRKAVVGQLNEVASHLEEHQAPDIERGLFRVMAYLGGTAATIAWDSGLQRQAQAYYLLALRAAHAGGDAAFGANVLAGMARQMLYRDRPQDALELVHVAQKGAGRKAGARLRAMLHTREAWAYAALGRPSAFRRATEEAAEALADAETDDEPYWIAYFDEAELAGVTGGRLLEMARQQPKEHAEAAADSIRQAVKRRGPEAGRSHALDMIGLAECHFLMGDVVGAVDHTQHAVEAAARTQSTRVRAQLSQLYPYTVGRSVSPRVAEVRTMVRDLLSN
ncbi:hypothetical protein [Streptomyces sp. NPDC093984]|uniref:hypothetical protein n=1 Tax=Streptomyces sp. NPDC093984 TaxID=3366052 RepID=UPI00382D24D9